MTNSLSHCHLHFKQFLIHTVDSKKGSHHTETDRQPSGVLILFLKEKKMLKVTSLATDIAGGAKDQG